MRTDLVWLFLFVWTFATFGFAYIVGHAAISQPIRDWLLDVDEARTVRRALCVIFVTMIECPVCLSTWVGLIGGGLIVHFEPWSPLVSSLIPIGLACYTAGTSFILGKTTKLIS